MDKKQQIYAALKPKVKSFGFTKKELMSVATLIEDNLELSEDATDEVVANAIDEQVDAVVPILKFGQSYASRIIDANKPTPNEPPVQPKSHEDDPKPNEPKDGEKDSESLKLLKALTEKFEKVENELAAIKSGKTAETRKSRLEKVLKDTGVYGQSVLKNFDRMKFDNDDEFDEYVADVENGLKEYNKERTEKGLKALGPNAAQGPKPHDNHKAELSDEQIDKLVEGIN